MLQHTWSYGYPIVVLALVQDVSFVPRCRFDPCLCRVRRLTLLLFHSETGAAPLVGKAGHLIVVLFRLLQTMVLEACARRNHIDRGFGDVVIFGVALCLFIVILLFELVVCFFIFWDYHARLRSTFSLFDVDPRPWQLELLIFSRFINCPSFQQLCVRTFATLSQMPWRFEMSTPFFLGLE